MKLESKLSLALLTSTVFLCATAVGFVATAAAWRSLNSNLAHRVATLEAQLAPYRAIAKDPEILREVLDRYDHNDGVRQLLMRGGSYKVLGHNMVIDCIIVKVPATTSRLWMAGL